ncbi:MAG: hypothetical protein ACPGD5_07565 [Salibacteraceae bacterium]
MNRIKNIDDTCELIKESLNDTLNKKGYELTKQEYHKESFGSRFFVWVNSIDKHCFRLIWDGKDSWFVLEGSPYVNDSEKVAWADVTIVPFDSNVENSDYKEELINSIIEEIG